MANKKLEQLKENTNNPDGMWRLFMLEEQIKTNGRLSWILAALGIGGAVVVPLLFLILDKVTGG